MSDKLDALYDRALKLPRDARAAFIAESCGDDAALRTEVLSLVAAAERGEQFFAQFGNTLSSSVRAKALDDAVASRSDSSSGSHRSSESDALSKDTVIGHYSIVGLLGRGGMGTVYQARDTRLDRDVALKFLSARLTSDQHAAERLLAEARAAASLEHPNVCVVHEIGETAEGQPFIAMALCDGNTLKQQLSSGPIAPDEGISIAIQVARALSAAHSRNIIHRDVKPGNIMLGADGTAKLLDFGLAKSTNVNVPYKDSTPGTVAYMSPEQLRGEPADHRTDLWSLGVVLYEMISGHRPFRGANNREIIRAILHDEPQSLRTVRTDIPARMMTIVERLLQKNPELRYESAATAITDLESSIANKHAHIGSRSSPRNRVAPLAGIAAVLIALAGFSYWFAKRDDGLSASLMREPSIAVLPLANDDSVDAPLATGMTEDLIATLAREGGVRVIASTSTAGFKNRTMDVRKIADSLGVSNILEGGIRRSGSHLRVEVRLVAARDGSTLWSQAYDREVKDMFFVQDDIVRTVAGELGLRFDKDRQLRRHHPRSMAAYQLYLLGSDPLLLRGQSGVWKAMEYFQQAIAVDSTYAAAHAGLALVQVRRGRTTADPGMPLPELFALAEKSARKAIALDDSLPEAHYSLARVLEVQLKFQEAAREMKRAIALDPTRSVYHRSMSTLHGWAGRPKDELAEARVALETDPLNPYARVAFGSGLVANGRLDEALVELNSVAAVKPPLQGVAFVIAQIYAKQKRLPESIAILRPGAEGGDPMYQGLLGCFLARAGQRDEANRMLTDLLSRYQRTSTGAFQVAMVYSGLGDLDQTFAWLNKSIDDRSISSMIMGHTFDDLHRDARFQKLNERLGFRPRT
ncbi:MAG TPA: protein kinase [Gemmatimonadaceae bacterium]|nr:protein kinase [Gemmatimonadaceae bacterium]